MLALIGLTTSRAYGNGPPPPPTIVEPYSKAAVAFDDEANHRARTSLKHFLSTFEVIRIYFVEAPGNGHQSANLRMMTRLRELGFNGEFQAVYHESNAAKFSYLLPGFDPAAVKTIQHLQPEGIGSLALIGESAATALVSEKAELGFSGANDRPTDLFLLRRLNVNSLVQLQPRKWSQRHSKREILIASTNEAVSLDHLAPLGSASQLSEISDWETLIKRELAVSNQLSAKIDGLRELVKSIDSADVMPAYSLDFPFAPDLLMEKIIGGIQQAFLSQPSLFEKPVIIPIFTEFKDLKKREALAKKLNELGVTYLDLSSAELRNTLHSMGRQQIVAVQVGAMPPRIFQGIFARATLPALLEGKNLSNTMVDLGLPFINVTGSGVDVENELIKLKLPSKSFDAFMSINHALKETSGLKPKAAALSVANYLIELRRTESPLRLAYAALANNPRSLNNDLVGQSLLELQRAMEKRGLTMNRCAAFLNGN